MYVTPYARKLSYDELNERPIRLPKNERLEWWDDRHKGRKDNSWKTWRKFQCRNRKNNLCGKSIMKEMYENNIDCTF